jgi:long-chain acyl-CoA synthetase
MNNPSNIYPENSLKGRTDIDVIPTDDSLSLYGLFLQRLHRSPDKLACRHFSHEQWQDYRWSDLGEAVARWQKAMQNAGLNAGDRVAIRLRNCPQWLIFDQAALGLGLIVVPLYVDDRAENIAYILEQTNSRLLLLENSEQWKPLLPLLDELPDLQQVLTLDTPTTAHALLQHADSWLPIQGELLEDPGQPENTATIMYTSGTTGKPKGVMLSHQNILSNITSGIQSIAITPNDRFLSFLPLSHALERAIGYYLPIMAGASIVYARSISELASDLQQQKPTVLVAVPRIFERVNGRIQEQLTTASSIKRSLFRLAVDVGWRAFNHRQGRAGWCPTFLLHRLLDTLVGRKIRQKLGGELRFAISGGAPLPPAVSQVFIGLGVNIVQGYGLTESSPVISVDTLEHNIPASIGLPLRNVEVKIGDKQELLARGPNIMQGYWENSQATEAIIDQDGWLHTGDQARIDEEGFIYIIGRLKEIIVLANGEKVPPADMESAITEDPIVEQCLVLGEQRAYLSALVVLEPATWKTVAAQQGFDLSDPTVLQQDTVKQVLLERIQEHICHFPGYANIRQVTLTLKPWDVESGLLTPTMKLKRQQICQSFQKEIDRMYAGH